MTDFSPHVSHLNYVTNIRYGHTFIELAGAAKNIQIEVQVQHTSKRKSDMEFLDLYEGGIVAPPAIWAN